MMNLIKIHNPTIQDVNFRLFTAPGQPPEAYALKAGASDTWPREVALVACQVAVDKETGIGRVMGGEAPFLEWEGKPLVHPELCKMFPERIDGREW
jgi:hypothetical protein